MLTLVLVGLPRAPFLRLDQEREMVERLDEGAACSGDVASGVGPAAVAAETGRRPEQTEHPVLVPGALVEHLVRNGPAPAGTAAERG